MLFLQQAIPILAGILVLDLVVFYLGFLSKWIWLGHIGMSQTTRLAIFSNRQNNFNLQDLIQHYGDRKLLIIDGVVRKSLHLVIGCYLLFIGTFLIKDPIFANIIIIMRYAILVIFQFIFLNSNKVFGMGGILFGGVARIRDGKYGRINILISHSVITLSLILLLVPVSYFEYLGMSQETIRFIVQFVFIPVIIGDAIAEVMGSIFGKQNIKVWGVGEINRKSWMGTISMFVGTLIPLLVLVTFSQPSLQWYLLALFISILSPIVELIAPRSTDNIIIPMVNMVAVIALLPVLF